RLGPPGPMRAAPRHTAAAGQGPAPGGSCSCSTCVSFLWIRILRVAAVPGLARDGGAWSLAAEHAAHADVATGAVAVGGEAAFQAPAAVVGRAPQGHAPRALGRAGTETRVTPPRPRH